MTLKISIIATRMPSISLSIVAALFLVGCASKAPQEGGFWGGLTGLFTGSYEERLATKNESWSEQENTLRNELEKKDNLNQSLQGKRDQAMVLDRRLETIKIEVEKLQSETSELRRQKKIDAGKLDALKVELARYQHEVDALQLAKSDKAADEAKALREEIEALQSALKRPD